MDATLVIWNKHMTKFLRSTEELLGLLLQSVLWVVLFGVGMRSMIGEVDGSDYMSYILPGIIALSALGGAVGGGMVLLDERLRGILKEYLAAPIPRLSILLGSATSTATKALFQALIMLVVGVLMAPDSPPTRSDGWPPCSCWRSSRWASAGWPWPWPQSHARSLAITA